MTEKDVFVIKQAIEMCEYQIENNSNSCELDYYIKVREELTEKLAQFLQDKKCEFCTKPCGQEWCSTKTQSVVGPKDLKDKK